MAHGAAIAKNLKEDQKLIEAISEYVTERDGIKIYDHQASIEIHPSYLS